MNGIVIHEMCIGGISLAFLGEFMVQRISEKTRGFPCEIKSVCDLPGGQANDHED